MTTSTQPSTFGLHVFVNDDDPSNPNTASHTGLLFYPNDTFDQGDPPMVLSFVNGTMCVNPLNDFVCSINFDGHASEVLDNYRQPRPTEPAVAYFNPETRRYQLAELPWP